MLSTTAGEVGLVTELFLGNKIFIFVDDLRTTNVLQGSDPYSPRAVKNFRVPRIGASRVGPTAVATSRLFADRASSYLGGGSHMVTARSNPNYMRVTTGVQLRLNSL
jgi:hypothetical protein